MDNTVDGLDVEAAGGAHRYTTLAGSGLFALRHTGHNQISGLDTVSLFAAHEVPAGEYVPFQAGALEVAPARALDMQGGSRPVQQVTEDADTGGIKRRGLGHLQARGIERVSADRGHLQRHTCAQGDARSLGARVGPKAYGMSLTLGEIFELDKQRCCAADSHKVLAKDLPGPDQMAEHERRS